MKGIANMSKIMKRGLHELQTQLGKNPLKLTALLYLKEALLKEQYEVCRDVIATAREFGATAAEIRNLLEDPRRSLEERRAAPG